MHVWVRVRTPVGSLDNEDAPRVVTGGGTLVTCPE